MSSQQPEFDIMKVLELTRHKKYEITAAGFAVLDKIEKIDIPKKMRTRKAAVQALHVLAEKIVKFDYFSAEERKKLLAEANMSDAPYKSFTGLFTNTAAPKVEEDTEEEDIPEEVHVLKSEDASEFDEEFEDEEDEDADDLDDDFDDEEAVEEDLEET